MNLDRQIAYSVFAAACVGCAGTPETTPDRPVRSACGDLTCFRERDIREVQLLDPDTMIVFVGPQQCAFRMELRGSNCGYVGFTVDFDLDRRSRVMGDQAPVCLNDRPYLVDPLNPTNPRSGEGVMPGGRGPAPAETDLRQCRVDQIIPLSDDGLLEAYVESGSQPPLPPVGSGEISVEPEEQEGSDQSAQEEPATDQGATDEQDAPETGSARADEIG